MYNWGGLEENSNKLKGRRTQDRLKNLGWIDSFGEEIPQDTGLVEEYYATKDQEDAILSSLHTETSVRRRKKPSYWTDEQNAWGKKYFALIENFLACEKNKRFGVEIFLHMWLRAYAILTKRNYIGLLTDDRRARNRAKKKFGALYPANNNPNYKLKEHTEKRGYYKNSWFVGNPLTEEGDLRKAKIEGPEQFYFPPEVWEVGYAIVKELHYTFLYYFDVKPDKRKAKGRLSRSARKIVDDAKLFGLYDPNQLRHILHGMFTEGIKAHARDLGFGRKKGRPRLMNNPSQAVAMARTPKGQKKIDEVMSKTSKDVGIAVKSKKKAKNLKATSIRRIGRWSIKPTTLREIKLRTELGEKLSPMDLLNLALEDIAPLLAVDLRQLQAAKPDAVWLRGERRPSFKQSCINSPRYSLLNKYNVSKERKAKPHDSLKL